MALYTVFLVSLTMRAMAAVGTPGRVPKKKADWQVADHPALTTFLSTILHPRFGIINS